MTHSTRRSWQHLDHRIENCAQRPDRTAVPRRRRFGAGDRPVPRWGRLLSFRMVGLRGISLVISAACLGTALVGEARGETGNAAYYHGRRAASGERVNATEFTAAHRTLPFGTQVRVTNLQNGRSVVVRINDRGPFGRARIIDVSRAAARELGMIGSVVAKVRLDPQ